MKTNDGTQDENLKGTIKSSDPNQSGDGFKGAENTAQNESFSK